MMNGNENDGFFKIDLEVAVRLSTPRLAELIESKPWEQFTGRDRMRVFMKLDGEIRRRRNRVFFT